MVYQKIMDDNKLLRFFKQHWFKLAVALFITASLGGWGQRFFKKRHHSSASDFKTADVLIDRLNAGEPLSSEAIEIVENILKRHPELHPKYDYLLAFCMMHQNNHARISLYTKSISERTAFAHNPYYHDFSETTQLIVEKRLIEAYDQAQKLENQLANDNAFCTLRAFNLLRLLCLTENPNEAESIWKKLQLMPNYTEIARVYSIGDFSLSDYAKSRFSLQDN